MEKAGDASTLVIAGVNQAVNPVDTLLFGFGTCAIISTFPRKRSRDWAAKLLCFGVCMKRSPSSTTSGNKHWKDLYIAALFESDKSKLPRKIADAQIAIVDRRRKVLATASDTSERQALDTALLSLQALANCLAITTRPPAEIRAEYVQATAARVA